MRWSILFFMLGICAGLLLKTVYDLRAPTTTIVLTSDIVNDRHALHKGTHLTYLDTYSEGYILASLTVAIEGEAISAVRMESGKPSSGKRYFYYEKQ